MPAYSFKERFVPSILDGSKTQTIRKKRKGQAIAGSILYLYYGLRTKFCKKLLEVVCVKVCEIDILATEDVFIEGEKLSATQKNNLAKADGFEDWETMYRWWNQTHSLPFKGDIIYW